MGEAIRRSILIVTLSIANLLGLIGASSVLSAAEITLYSYYLPHRLTRTSDKQYDLLLKELLADGDIRFSHQTAPLKRSSASFRSNPVSCVWPANPRALKAVGREGTDDLISSEPLDVVSLRLYTHEKPAGPVSIDVFEPERIGYIRGSGAIPLLGEKSKRFIPLSSEEQLISMLELGRLDAFLGHHPDTALALDDLEKPGVLHVTPLAILNLRFPVSFVCHDNKQTRSMLMKLNPRIKVLAASGRLKEILGEHAEFEDPQDSAKQDF